MGRGLPILGAEAKLERKGRSAAEVCTSEARKIGEAPCAARSGQSPLASLSSLSACVSTHEFSGSRCGRNRPLRWEAENAQTVAAREEAPPVTGVRCLSEP